MNEKDHYLVIASEKSSSIIDACGRSLRLGLHRTHSLKSLSYAEMILEEFNDLTAVIELLFDRRYSTLLDPLKIEKAQTKVLKQLNLSKTLDKVDPDQTLDEAMTEYVIRCLNHNNGHRGNTAKQLQISERTLYRRIRDYEQKQLENRRRRF